VGVGERSRNGGNWLKENKSSSIKDIIIGVVLIALIGFLAIRLLGVFLGCVGNFINRLTQVASNMDVVVIVALITGSISILSVVISSIVSKIIEYRQNTKRYLYEKKEEPYSEFIEMVYKIQENAKETKEYRSRRLMFAI
jgi:ABC-type multidrug transport system fused ATPase/permease subunit